MNHQPRDSRRQAAHKFVDALDELEAVFQPEHSDDSSQQRPDHPASDTGRSPSRRAAQRGREAVDFGSLLDDAVQDIEQFMTPEESPDSES